MEAVRLIEAVLGCRSHKTTVVPIVLDEGLLLFVGSRGAVPMKGCCCWRLMERKALGGSAVSDAGRMGCSGLLAL